MTIVEATKEAEEAAAAPAAFDPALRIEMPLAPRRAPYVFAALAAALVFHAALIALAVLGDRIDGSDLPDERTIPVEIVPDVPKPPPAPKIDWKDPPKDFAEPKKEPEKPAEKQPDRKPEPDRQAKPQRAPEAPPTEAPKPDSKPPPKAATRPLAAAKSATPPPEPQGQQPALAQSAPTPPPAPGDPAPASASKAAAAPPALLQPPAPVLRSMDQIYAPMAFEVPFGTFQQHALTAAGQKEADDYKAQVFALLEQAKQIPESARARGAKGVAIVGFTIDLDGKLVSASILHSSGDAELDAAAMATVERAAPFPLPPPEAQRSFTPALVFGDE